MRLTLLGTGTSLGVPIIGCPCEVCLSMDYRDKRLRTSAFLQVHGKNILIDGGPDLRQQAIKNGIRRIDAVILTHEHRDHTAGLDELRAFNYLQKARIPVFAWSRVLLQIRKDYEYVFESNPYPGIPQLDLYEIDGKQQTILGVNFSFPTVLHGKLPVMGIVIDDLAYLTDVKTIDQAERLNLKGLKTLVLNTLQHEDHISHLTYAEAMILIKELSPAQTYLTHVSHRLGLHVKVDAALPPNIKLGYDGMVIDF